MKRCIIFSAGSYYGLRIRPEKEDLVLAADGGYHACLQAGLKPDILLGDFDSTQRPDTTCPVISYPAEKDDTDTMLAIRTALAKGHTEIHIFGGTGGERMDHTLANIQALSFIARAGGHGFLYDKNAVFTVLCNGTVHIPRMADNGTLSVFSLSDTAENVTIKGAKYSMKDGRLDRHFPLGISNSIVEKAAAVSVKNGSLLIGVELPETGNCAFDFS